VSLQHAAQFKLAVSAQYGVGINGQIHGQLPDRWQLIAGGQRARSHTGPYLVDELAVYRHSAMQVEREAKRKLCGLALCSHINY
jgi:hypothetical protein